MAVVRRTFTFDARKDARLIEWLETQPNASETARAALWAAYRGQGGAPVATLTDVVKAIEGLGARLAGLQVTTAAPPVGAVEEDPDLVEALEKLGI